MNIRTDCSSIVISFLLAGSLNAQNYVLEWQSPDGLRLPEFMLIDDFFWDTHRFDMEGDGILEIWAITVPFFETKIFDGATHTLKWSFPDSVGDLLGFWDFDGDGLKEALFENRDAHSLLFVNWETSEVEFTLGDALTNYEAKSAFDIDNDGKYELIVRQNGKFEIWGDGTTTGVSEVGPFNSPQAYTLSQNYPNPFNPATKIEYAVQQAGHVTIRVYNLRGEIVRTLVDTQRSMGEYAAVWDGKNDRGSSVASGQYFYQLSIGDFVTSKKLLLLK